MRLGGLLVCTLVIATACTPARPALPSGNGTPFPAFETAYEEAVNACRPARTVLAELGLSGRAGGTKLRGRINAGIAAPGDMRLEAVAFGRPIFILAARAGQATLLLTRDDRVVRDAPAEAIVEALTGVALTPADLLAVVAGCGLGAATPSAGRSFNDEWAAVDTAGATTYLRRVDGHWRVGGAVREQLQVLYSEFQRGTASVVHIKAAAVADITLRVSQLEINTAIEPKAFDVEVPREAVAMTLEELRRSGPLGEK